MKRLLISEEAFADLNDGFLFYDLQESGLGDYFIASLRSDIESLRISAGSHRLIAGFYRALARTFPFGIFYTVTDTSVIVWAVLDLRRDPKWLRRRLSGGA